jgi:hypothetical protein
MMLDHDLLRQYTPEIKTVSAEELAARRKTLAEAMRRDRMRQLRTDRRLPQCRVGEHGA